MINISVIVNKTNQQPALTSQIIEHQNQTICNMQFENLGPIVGQL